MSTASVKGNLVELKMNDGHSVFINCASTKSASLIAFAISDFVADAVFSLREEELIVTRPGEKLDCLKMTKTGE